MKTKFIQAFGSIQELFCQLSEEGKVTAAQAEQFNQAQKVVVNYSSWVDAQLNPIQKVDLPWDDDRFTQAWQLWKEYKKQQFNFTYKLIGEQSALLDLTQLSKGDMELSILIIHQSIKKGWKGFFQLPKVTEKKQAHSVANLDHKKDLFKRLTNK